MHRSLRLLIGGVLLFVALGWMPANAQGQPDLGSIIRSLDQLDFCGEPVPLDIEDVRERLDKELMLAAWDQPQVLLWLKRSGRYFPEMTEILKKNGLPEDLRYLSVVESALRPSARSDKEAVGFWQFIAPTGKRYGLRIDDRVDERQDYLASTLAAAKYLKDLYNIFGSWPLAAAAYNMGEEGLSSQIRQQGVKDYYKLFLPSETQQFVFKILAVKIIFQDPGKYGVVLTGKDYYPPLEYSTVTARCDKEIHIRAVADAANTYYKAIKDLNPHVRGCNLAEGTHLIRVPKAGAEGFEDRFAIELAKVAKVIPRQEERVYVVKTGDSLSKIATHFGVPVSSLKTWNKYSKKKRVRPGDKLVVKTHKNQGEACLTP